MGIWAKISDVLRADLNDLLDKASDPMKQFNLMLSDMQDFRQKRADDIGKALTALKMVEGDIVLANEALVRWKKRAEYAVKVGNDDNAKFALQQQIQQENLINILDAALTQHRKNVETLKLDLSALDQKISDLESKRSIVEVRVRTAQAQRDIRGPISSHSHTPNADEVLHRVENQIRHVEAEAAAAGEVVNLQRPKSAEDRFTAEDANAEIEKRLAALKAAK